MKSTDVEQNRIVDALGQESAKVRILPRTRAIAALGLWALLSTPIAGFGATDG